MIPTNPPFPNVYKYLGFEYTYHCHVEGEPPAPGTTLAPGKKPQTVVVKVSKKDLDIKPNARITHEVALTRDQIVAEGIVFPNGINLRDNLDWLKANAYIPRYWKTTNKVAFVQSSYLRQWFSPDPNPGASDCGKPFFWFAETFFSILTPNRYNPIFVELKHCYADDEAPAPAAILPPPPITLPPQPDPTPPVNVNTDAQATPASPSPENVDAAAQTTPASLPLPKMPFPTAKLQELLSSLDALNAADLVHMALQNSEKASSPLFSRFLQHVSKFDPKNFSTLIDGNANPRFIHFLYSNLKEGAIRQIFQFLMVDKTDPTKLEEAGEFGRMLLAQNKIIEWLNSFYSDGTLDMIKLAFATLQDKALHDYLVTDEAKGIIIKLCLSLRITHLKKEDIENSLNMFTDLQNFFIEKGNGNLTTLKDLEELCKKNLEDTLKQGKNFFKLLGTLVDIIKPFIASPLRSLEYLFKKNGEGSHKKYAVNSQNNLSLYDFKTSFEKFRDKSLGILISSTIGLPSQHLINARLIEGISFTDVPQEGSISPNFFEFAFEDFSFKNSHFNNCKFRKGYFKRCNFSGVKFSGAIEFENCYMDQKTADSLKEAIANSAKDRDLLHILGLETILIISKKTASNQTILIEDSLSSSLQKKSNQSQDYVVEVSEASDEEEVPQKPEGYFSKGVGFVKKTAGFAIGVPKAAAGKAFSFVYNPLSSSESQKIDSQVKQEKAAESRTSSKIEKAEGDLRNIRDIIEAEISKHISALNNPSQNSSQIGEIKTQLQNQQAALDHVNRILFQTEAQRREKQKIAAEQHYLLNHTNPNVRTYYQTLLSNLAGYFHSIALTNNSYSILKLDHGKVTKHSNQGSKTGNLTGKDTTWQSVNKWLLGAGDKFIEPFENLSQFGSAASAFFSSVLPTIASSLPPSVTSTLTSFIPLPGIQLVTTAMESIVTASDKGKINQTKEAYKGLTPHTTEKIACAIAREISLAYEEQICLLSSEAVEKFAEYAIGAIAASLLNGHINDSHNFTALAFRTLREIDYTQNATLGPIEIPFSDMSLSTLNNKTYKAKDLYKHSRVAVRQGSEWIKCFLNYGENAKDEYGFIHVTQENLKAYFPNHTPSGEKWTPSLSLGAAPIPESSPLPPPSTVTNSPFHLLERLDKLALDTLQASSELLAAQQKQEALIKEQADIKKMLAMYMSGQRLNFESPPTPSGKPAGMHVNPKHQFPSAPPVLDLPPSLGNSDLRCYINAPLQVILTLPSIVERIIQHQAKTDNPFADDFRAKLKNAVTKKTTSDVTALRDALFRLADWKELDPKLQYDANDFLIKVLEVIGWNTQVHGIVEGKTTMKVNREPVKVRKELRIPPENSFSMPIDSCSSFQQVVDNYFSWEKLEEGTKIEISKDYLPVQQWYKQVTISGTANEYIMVHLKRYKQIKPGSSVTEKDFSKIQFPKDSERIRVPCFDGNERKEVKYEIAAYILHKGEDRDGGHYVSYVKTKHNGWYFVNDSRCKQQDPHVPYKDGEDDYVYTTSKDAYIVVLKKA